MADRYIEFCRLTYEGVDLDDVVVSLEENNATPTTVVNTMNKSRRGRGFKRKNRTHTLTINAEQIDDPRVPDWNELQRTGKRFALTKKPDKGRAITYTPCVVDSVRENTTDGEGSLTISVIALERR